QFRKRVQGIASRFILAHIRQASNPRKLPRSEVLGLRHTQPFCYKELAFIHNGTLNIPLEVAQTLGKYRRYLAGNNDSEVLFLLIAKVWEESGGGRGDPADWKKIFAQVRARLQKVWKSIPARRRKPAHFAHGLNVVVSDGRSLAAQCSYIP